MQSTSSQPKLPASRSSPLQSGAPSAARRSVPDRRCGGRAPAGLASVGAVEAVAGTPPHFSDAFARPRTCSAFRCFSSFHLSICGPSARERGETREQMHPHPFALAVAVCPAVNQRARRLCKKHSLEVIPAHLPIALVARQAAVRPLCRLVARIEVLAGLLSDGAASIANRRKKSKAHFMNWARASLVHGP